jgi:lysophospholipase L1-like esterase
VALLEGFDHPAASDRGTYGEDGFHPSEEGHRRAAMEFLRALKGRFRPPRDAPPREAPA